MYILGPKCVLNNNFFLKYTATLKGDQEELPCPVRELSSVRYHPTAPGRLSTHTSFGPE